MERCKHGMIEQTCYICSGMKSYVETKLASDIRAKRKAEQEKQERELQKRVERERIQRKNRICTNIINEAEKFVGDISFEYVRGDLSKLEMMEWDEMREIWAEAIYGHSATFQKMADFYPDLMAECLEICSNNY